MRTAESKRAFCSHLGGKSGSSPSLNLRRQRPLLMATIAAAAAMVPHREEAVDFIKANNTTNLNNAGSWVNNAVPGGADALVWDATVTAANTVNIGNNLSIGGIRIANPGGPVTIGGTQTFSYQSLGIDMSAA